MDHEHAFRTGSGLGDAKTEPFARPRTFSARHLSFPATAFVFSLALWACAGGDPSPRSPSRSAAETPEGGERRSSAAARLSALEKAVVRDFLEFWPNRAGGLGLHGENDGRWPDLAEAAVAKYTATLKTHQATLAKLAPTLRGLLGWKTAARQDFEALTLWVDSQLWELAEHQVWRKNPRWYLKWAGRGTRELVNSETLATKTRQTALNARWRTLPGFLAAAQANLAPEGASQEVLDSAVIEGRGLIEEIEYAEKFVDSESSDPAWSQAARNARDALSTFVAFLEARRRDAAPEKPWGEAKLAAWLACFEGIETSVARMIADLEASLADLNGEITSWLNERFGGVTLDEAMGMLRREHSSNDSVHRDFEQAISTLRAFTVDHGLVALPDDLSILVRQAPAGDQGRYIAELRSPGPFDHDSPWVFNVAPVDADSPQALEGPFYNRYARPLIVANLVYPGFGTMAYFAHQTPGDARRIFESAVHNAGWQHYAEHLLVEQGFESANPGFRLQQLHFARWRAIRAVLALSYHQGRWDQAECLRFLTENCAMSAQEAEGRFRHAQQNPDDFAAAYGKLRVLRLRERCRDAWGRDFSLARFHERFLEGAYAPLPLIEGLLLGAPIADLAPVYPVTKAR